jgi:ankyrin repeat protein
LAWPDWQLILLNHAKLAQPNLVADNGVMDSATRLLDAIKVKDARRVRTALAAGASLAMMDGQKSPLHAAAEAGNVEVLLALPAAGVRKLIDKVDSTDRTPLMCAAQKNHVEAARVLLELGAKANARNSTGDTALRVAAAEGTPEMARLLLEAGADPTIPGRLLLTPLDRARERRTPEGRMITALILRATEAKASQRPASRGKTASNASKRGHASLRNRQARGKSKQQRKVPRRGVK